MGLSPAMATWLVLNMFIGIAFASWITIGQKEIDQETGEPAWRGYGCMILILFIGAYFAFQKAVLEPLWLRGLYGLIANIVVFSLVYFNTKSDASRKDK